MSSISSKSTASSFNLIGGKIVTPSSTNTSPLDPRTNPRGPAGPARPGLIVKESYWRWPQRNLAGNTIDFFVQVLGMKFHNAMRQITGSYRAPSSIENGPRRSSDTTKPVRPLEWKKTLPVRRQWGRRAKIRSPTSRTTPA